MSLGFGDVKCMQTFNVYFSDIFFMLWRSVIYYVRTCNDIMFFTMLLGKLVIYIVLVRNVSIC